MKYTLVKSLLLWLLVYRPIYKHLAWPGSRTVNHIRDVAKTRSREKRSRVIWKRGRGLLSAQPLCVFRTRFNSFRDLLLGAWNRLGSIALSVF